MIYVINAPFIFTAAWRMIQPLLDERTRSKIDILGSDVTKMHENIDKSELEPPWGTHAKFAIPDPIVQVAIDNEKYLNVAEESAEQSSETSVAPGVAIVASSSAAADGSPPATSAAKQSRPLRKSVRKMLRRMLFITEKRAAATSLGVDPDQLADTPKKLAPSGKLSLGGKKSSDAVPFSLKRSLVDDEDAGDTTLDGEAEDTEKDLAELRDAHDKLLAKLKAVESAAVLRARLLQRQIYVVLLILLGCVAWVLQVERA
jgi:hypothetical protein